MPVQNANNLFSANGQVVIGNQSTGFPSVSTLTAGTGITIANGAGSITISATGGGLTWSDKNANFSAAINNGYFIVSDASALLPASPSQGDTVAFRVIGAAGLTVQANIGQTISVGNVTSAVDGEADNTSGSESLTLVYRAATTQWESTEFTGAWEIP